MLAFTALLLFLCSHYVMSDSLVTPMDCSPDSLLCPWNFPGNNTELGCYETLNCANQNNQLPMFTQQTFI